MAVNPGIVDTLIKWQHMQYVTGVIVLIALAALSLIIFLIVRNQKDKKKLFPPGSGDDEVQETRQDQRRQKDKL